MTDHKTISIFAGKPVTTAFTSKKHGVGYRIVIRELTPLRAKALDSLAWIWFVLMAYVIFIISENTHQYGQAGLTIGGIIFLIFLSITGLIYFHIFLKKTTIIITGKLFCVKSFWGSKKYDRQLRHKFSLLPHDKAQEEKISLDLKVREAQARRKIISPKIYYGKSYHLVFEHMGQRRDITTIFGHNDALAALARLNACDQVINAKTGSGDGTATDPIDQWGEQTGEIPND